MINIFIKEKQVIIRVEHKYPVQKFVTDFICECPSEFFAKLIEQNISNNFYETVEKIRKLEYEAGWSDAKKKKRKRDYFYQTMTKNEY